MKKFFISLAAGALCLAASSTTWAGDFNGVDQALIGVNGVLTSPVDPIVGLIEGHRAFAFPVVAPVTTRLGGLAVGAVHGALRLATGALDIVLAPLPVTSVSPPPRVDLVAPDGPTGPPPGF